MEKNIYYARVNGKNVKKFTKSKNVFMNKTWERFNKYCYDRGYTTMVHDPKYLGVVAWKNDSGDIMELVSMQKGEI
jgi:hypothetical protein